jgi:hypothetical protein
MKYFSQNLIIARQYVFQLSLYTNSRQSLLHTVNYHHMQEMQTLFGVFSVKCLHTQFFDGFAALVNHGICLTSTAVENWPKQPHRMLPSVTT